MNFLDTLYSKGLMTKDILGQAIAEHYDVPYSDLNSQIPNRDQVMIIPEDIAKNYRVILFKNYIDGFVVATDNPKKAGIQKDLKDKEKAYYLADSCAEIALQTIWNNESFTGNGNLSASNGTCDYTVSNTGGSSREIIVTANVNDSIQKVEVNITDIKPEITIDSWRHVE